LVGNYRLISRAADVLEPAHLQYLEKIVRSSQRMNTLIEDLLNFSRLSQKDIGFSKVDLNAVLKQILSDFEISIQEKNATIRFCSLPVVNGIPLHLGQVFQNLISNSLKFAHPQRSPVYRPIVRNCYVFQCFLSQDHLSGQWHRL
jgi:signal transduction histidine kinase